MSTFSTEETEKLQKLGASAAKPEVNYVAQMPKIVCNFTKRRKLYLLPGMKIEGSHQKFVNVPNHAITMIVPSPGLFTNHI